MSSSISPPATGHKYPAMFCYWTFNGYTTPTSYNGHNNDFHFHGADTVLGLPITDFSIAGGAQLDVYCLLWFHQVNWWLYIGGDQEDNVVGYFPGDLYGGGPLASGATEADFGGEVCGGPPFAAMGSGAFASAGPGLAAYQRNLGVYDANANFQTSLNLQIDEADPASYTVAAGASEGWGDYFYFGGPGGN